MAASEAKPHWPYPTPDRLVVVLLVLECLLWLSNWLGWWHKGYAVLVTIAVAGFGVFLLLILLWFVVALIFRRRFQFSLRTLLGIGRRGRTAVQLACRGDEEGEGAEGGSRCNWEARGVFRISLGVSIKAPHACCGTHCLRKPATTRTSVVSELGAVA